MPIFPKSSQVRQRPNRKSRGQSLVELAIAFPVILILFTGLIEFGFILNYYLSLLDATREAARFYSNADPFEDGFRVGNCMCPASTCPNEAPVDTADADCDRAAFYDGAAAMVLKNLQPRDLAHPEEDSSRKIFFNPSTDDIIISVFDIRGAGLMTRYPAGDYHWFGNMESGISDADITNQLISGAPNKIILLVEVYYAHHQILAFPWFSMFVPDPVMLHAYTMMPMPAVAEGNH